MACAIEDAGLEIRDSLHWMYGSGFPKSRDLAKDLDKQEGIWRGRAGGIVSENPAMSGGNYERTPKGKPVTEAAAAWDGWQTALKPAHEPFVLARKPLIGTLVENVVTYGAGVININACRVPAFDGYEKAWDRPVSTNIGAKGGAFISTGEQHTVDISGNKPSGGRWPTNVVLSHSIGCMPNACLDGCPVQGIDQQSGEEVSKFFPVLNWDPEYDGAFFYQKKVSRSEREAGCESLEAKTPTGAEIGVGLKSPRAGAGRTQDTLHNNHPTVKPWRLMEWCIRLVTPPGGIVLDPFMGSGSTGIAAVHARAQFIGIEREPEYIQIAAARIAHARSMYEY